MLVVLAQAIEKVELVQEFKTFVEVCVRVVFHTVLVVFLQVFDNFGAYFLAVLIKLCIC